MEYAGLALLVALLLLAATHTARAGLAARAAGDAGYLQLAARHAPTFVLERGDSSLPVDFRRCRSRACASRDPVVFVHGVRADDWEGLIVKLLADGTVVGARASAHLGWNGARPWWELKPGDWAPYPAPVYRAAGSHAGSFREAGIDLAGDRWDGPAGSVKPRLVPADQAREAAAAFGSGSVPPWDKAAWTDPEATITGRPGDRAPYARYARWWASLCVPCG